ncbi:hypothetical protein R50072_38250 [Simiduia litorea]|uniref:M48 family metallopeptidase n=1 Tax=Simiduia litorea TaxID=1435348 RepID=UPI0036F26C15
MTEPLLYPAGPECVPENLTKAKPSYKRQVWLAMAGLMVFMCAYIALMVCFGLITYKGFIGLSDQGFDLFKLIITPCAGILTLFMAKSLFAVRRSGDPRGMEVSAENQPELYRFIHTLADEIGAPRPHRVFLTPEVNAAVFYDLSLLNLLFPSKKNLIIGMGLVNVLSFGELKAVLAHEFGHFAQRSMMVGRWVYIAQQIIGHMVATRDWLDSIVRFIGRIDLRIAWIGWLLSLVIWSIRAVVDSLFGLVIMAERALSREMEFNADLVAVSVTGSDALINALYKLQAADHGWQTALQVAENEARSGKRLTDLFTAQRVAMEAMRKVLDDEGYGVTPRLPEGQEQALHRVFSEATAKPPEMWATHPANRDREDNAKYQYVASAIDERTAWVVFENPAAIRTQISEGFYTPDKRDEMEAIAAKDAVMKRFSHTSLEPEYRGNYLSRSPMRNFASVQDILATGELAATATESLAKLYPLELKAQLSEVRSLTSEMATLKALQRGDLKPSGGVIRHRGEELKKADIPEALEQLAQELEDANGQLKVHDALCRRAHLQAAEAISSDCHDYLLGLLKALHCVEHLEAVVQDEQALLTNTWLVITADGQIGYFEKRRMIRVATKVQAVMRDVSAALIHVELSSAIHEKLGIEDWKTQCPAFTLVDVTKGNWGEWCPAASEQMSTIAGLLGYLNDLILNELIVTERAVAAITAETEVAAPFPEAGKVPEAYPVLLPGQENVLQRKLDLWNRFQLAHGFMPSLARLLVAGAIVGGTIYGGLIVL